MTPSNPLWYLILMRRFFAIAFLAAILFNINFACQTICTANHMAENHGSKAFCHMGSNCKHSSHHCGPDLTGHGSEQTAKAIKCDCGKEKKLSSDFNLIHLWQKEAGLLSYLVAYTDGTESVPVENDISPPHRPPEL